MKKSISAVIVAFWAFAMTACGGAQKDVQWVRKPMHPSGNFDGVYQSDFGRLEMTAAGNKITALYEDEGAWGRLEGEVKDNLLYFHWTQWNEDMQGKTRKTQGEGVFQYVVEEVPIGTTGEKTKEYHKLKGWWGYEDGKLINRWNASKLSSRAKKRLEPHQEQAGEMDETSYSTSAGFDEVGGDVPEPAPAEPEEEESGDSLDDIF